MSTVEREPIAPGRPGEEWSIHEIVAQLKQLREESLIARERIDRPVKLPSRKILVSIVEKLGAALFPHRLGARDLAPDVVDYFVGHTLDLALQALAEQVQTEVAFASEGAAAPDGGSRIARGIVQSFAERLPAVRALLETDIRAAYQGDPAAHTVDEVLACYPGITAVLHHRLAHALHQAGAPLSARIIADIAHSVTGIDIHPAARIAGSFFIDHGTGVVIGETAIIGQRVRLYHGVTLGARRLEVDANAGKTQSQARHPIVEDDVVIYAGATVLGRVTIGQGSVIGGNVWLTHSVPAHSTISQARLRSEAFHSGSGI